MKKIIILASIGSLFSWFALASVGAEGHGGGAFVCRNPSGEISSEPLAVELQDLWEGVYYYHLPLQRSPEAWEIQLSKAMEKLRAWNFKVYEKASGLLGYILNHRVSVQSRVAIATPSDARAQTVKRGCLLEGIASFDELSGDLLQDEELVSHLSPTDYAALMAHEAIYKVFRGQGEINSLRARRFTAFIFSSQSPTQLWQGVPAEAQICRSDDGRFVFAVYRPTEKEVVLQFETVDGFHPMAVTRGSFSRRSMAPGKLELLADGKTDGLGIDIGLLSIGAQKAEAFQVQSEFEKYAVTLGSGEKFSFLRCKKNDF